MREEETSVVNPDEPKARGRAGMLVAVAALLVSIGAGTALGVTLIGPRVAAARPPADTVGVETGTKHGKDGDASRLYSVESLVVNPSGTAGTRFLIATVTVELDEVRSVDVLKARDAATRDALLHVLGSKSIEELSDIGRRDSLKHELAGAIGGVIGGQRVRKLFLPQFVLQ